MVPSPHRSTALGAEESVVLIQVGGDELWEISLKDHLQEHVCCCVELMFSPEEDRRETSDLFSMHKSMKHCVWTMCPQVAACC